MSTPATPNPYSVLGVSKDATTADIRTAYRKLVLKCHPDKIQDESKRIQGQDEFQKVQEAYELLSDESKRAKHDQKVQNAEARKASSTEKTVYQSSPYFKTTAFEYRGGKFYEEKTFVRPQDDDDIRFTEEPRASSRKYDGYERKTAAKDSDEKKKSKSDSKKESSRSAKEKMRESVRSSRSDRAKTRDKERRREQSEKQRAAYVVSENDSESDKNYNTPRSSKTTPVYERKEPKSKYMFFEDSAFDYIQRSRAGVTPEPERRPSAAYQPYYETVEATPHDTARRSSARPPRLVRHESAPRREPIEIVDSSSRGRAASRKSTSPPSAAGIRLATGLRGGPTRAATYQARETKEAPTLRRAETAPLSTMASRRTEPPLPKSSKARDRYDSGYSSPGTPEMHGSPPKSSKFTIVDEDEEYPRGHRTVLVDPYKRHQSVSPGQRRMTPVTLRSTSRPAQTRPREVPMVRNESARVIPPSRSSAPLRHGRDELFGEVNDDDYFQRFSSEQVRYSPRIRQEDIRFSHNKQSRPAVMRKESYVY